MLRTGALLPWADEFGDDEPGADVNEISAVMIDLPEWNAQAAASHAPGKW